MGFSLLSPLEFFVDPKNVDGRNNKPPAMRVRVEGYVSTVGLNEETIRKYIREQEKHDIALDKLSVKEYEDPFTK